MAWCRELELLPVPPSRGRGTRAPAGEPSSLPPPPPPSLRERLRQLSQRPQRRAAPRQRWEGLQQEIEQRQPACLNPEIWAGEACGALVAESKAKTRQLQQRTLELLAKAESCRDWHLEEGEREVAEGLGRPAEPEQAREQDELFPTGRVMNHEVKNRVRRSVMVRAEQESPPIFDELARTDARRDSHPLGSAAPPNAAAVPAAASEGLPSVAPDGAQQLPAAAPAKSAGGEGAQGTQEAPSVATPLHRGARRLRPTDDWIDGREGQQPSADRRTPRVRIDTKSIEERASSKDELAQASSGLVQPPAIAARSAGLGARAGRRAGPTSLRLPGRVPQHAGPAQRTEPGRRPASSEQARQPEASPRRAKQREAAENLSPRKSGGSRLVGRLEGTPLRPLVYEEHRQVAGWPGSAEATILVYADAEAANDDGIGSLTLELVCPRAVGEPERFSRELAKAEVESIAEWGGMDDEVGPSFYQWLCGLVELVISAEEPPRIHLQGYEEDRRDATIDFFKSDLRHIFSATQEKLRINIEIQEKAEYSPSLRDSVREQRRKNYIDSVAKRLRITYGTCEALYEWHCRLDTNGDKRIDADELAATLQQACKAADRAVLTKEQVKRLWLELQSKRDMDENTVLFPQFAGWLVSKFPFVSAIPAHEVRRFANSVCAPMPEK